MSCINVLPKLYLLDSMSVNNLDSIIAKFDIKYILNQSLKYVEIANNEIPIENYDLTKKINLYDFENLNKILYKNFSLDKNCLIISENNFLGWIIYCGFVIKYFGLTIIESLNMYKKFDIDFSNIPETYIQNLFDYYNFSTKL